PHDVDARALRQPDAIKGRINVRAGNGYALVPPSPGYMLLPDAKVHDAPAALIEHCRARETNATGRVGEYDARDVAELVRFLADEREFDDYQAWVSCGMALKIACSDAGLDVWRLATWDEAQDQVAGKWQSFASEPRTGDVTLLSLMARAHALGWK